MRTFTVDTWAFALDDHPEAGAKAFDDSTWRTVTVPHDWSVEQDFSPTWSSGTAYLPGGVGWYRARVALSSLDLAPGRRLRLVFRGAYKNADVWANGYHLGSRPSGWAEFSFDLTELVGYSQDDDLVIAVRLEHTDVSDSRWYNGSGLTRRVDLEVHERVWIVEHGTTVTTLAVEPEAATVRVEHVLRHDGERPRAVEVRCELRPLDGDGPVHAFGTTVDVPAGASATVVLTERIAPARLWSDDAPHLYRLATTLVVDGEPGPVEATYLETVGLRTVDFDAERGFFVNGRPRTLRGVCLHEDAGCLGTAVPTVVWLRRLLALQALGANAVRMAHNPHSPELYALCDLLGLYVIDEAFDEWENPKNKWWQGHNVYPPRHEGYAKHFPAWHEHDLAAMIGAHKNHACVIAWSIGNEVDYPNDPYASPLFAQMTGNNDAAKPESERVYDPTRPDARRLTTIADRLVDLVRAADPSRAVTLAAAFPELSTRTGLLRRLDLVGYNYKEHLYVEDHRRFPDSPLVGSENGHGYEQWRAVLDHDFVAGQFLWTGIDYLGEAHGWPIHGSAAGLLTLAGFAKDTAQLRRAWWSDQPVAHLVTRPHTAGEEPTNFWRHPVARTWAYEPGTEVEVLCFSNADDLELTCGDAPVPLTWDDRHGYWRGVLKAQPAPLVLTAHHDGRTVTDVLEPRLAPARIDAHVWPVPADAAARCAAVGLSTTDVVQVECTLRDEHGTPAGEDLEVTAEVIGGTLLGLENGDLADNTPYARASRRTLDARLVVFVRGGAGTTLRLTAAGLPDVEVVCG